MKKHLLLTLMLLVTLLTATTFGLSLYAYTAQKQAMSAMMRAYVLDMVENFADGFTAPKGHMMGRGYGMRTMHLRMLSANPALPGGEAGGVLFLGNGGKILAASPEAEKLLPLWQNVSQDLEPREVTDAAGRVYFIAARTLQAPPNEVIVFAAVSKSRLLAPVLSAWNFWLLSIIISSAAVLGGMLALWLYLVLPLRRIAEEISKIRWGRELPKLPQERTYELKALTDILTDLAQTAVAKEELKVRYVSDLVAVQESESRRLARELHDGPLQSVVAGLKRVQLAQEALLATAPPETAQHLEAAEKICLEAAGEIRDYCEELSPSWLKLGLASALFENGDRLSRTYEVSIHQDLDESLAATEEQSLALVRILQEAVSNSVRHGKADSIDVHLKQENSQIVFTLEDNGEGFSAEDLSDEIDFERLRTNGHRGLANMNERVQMLHGTLTIRSTPGQGCRIEVRF